MNYEYVHIDEETNLQANFKKQLEIHNKRQLAEFSRTEFTDAEIVDTYRNRSEVEKYSHLATLEEIAENDYNLNIPRYVDTFEEEEPIDIKAVMAEIKELETKRSELDVEIEGYLKELGLIEQ
jgi:type I restriction-modification system DNA methylase subunit